MDRIETLKKLHLIKYNDSNWYNGDSFYTANKKNPLYWILCALYFFVFTIPYIFVGVYFGLISIYADFKGLYEITEKGDVNQN